MNRPAPSPAADPFGGLFAGLVGAFLGLALLKFGNPVILDRLIAAPQDAYEVVFLAWPIAWGYGMLIVLALAGLVVALAQRPIPSPPGDTGTRRLNRWLVWLPVAWLVWQFGAAATSIEPRLTRITLVHFSALVVCFYLGLFALARIRAMKPFWTGLLAGFLIVLWTGFNQHYGGLEATRQYIYSQPGWENLPAEHLKRIASNRIFATLLYPNTLGGTILLLLPPLLVAGWRLSARLTPITRAVLIGSIAYAGIACLIWSGSKAGWLIALSLTLVGLLHQPFSRQLKLLLVGLLLVGGLTGFFVKFSAYFTKGAPSVGARFDYWSAAWKTALAHPFFGSGPGTFSVAYRALKPANAEMALLTHNDYLEQASDSGAIGALAYLVFVVGSMVCLYPKSRCDPLRFATWLGLLGWSLQSVVEFGLYIPAVGWTSFWLLGWLWGVPLSDKSVPQGGWNSAG